MTEQTDQPETGTAKVLIDICNERQRQQIAEGYSASNDDNYTLNELAFAAGCYALQAARSRFLVNAKRMKPDINWPWHEKHWKPTTPRRDLVKAAALIVAEIERLDRKGND